MDPCSASHHLGLLEEGHPDGWMGGGMVGWKGGRMHHDTSNGWWFFIGYFDEAFIVKKTI